MAEPPTLVRQGEELVSRWENALAAVEDAKRVLNRAECDLGNATTALGKWMTPSDAKPGETFSVWHGSELLTVINS